MSASARIFACFVDWCAGAGLNASNYRITITPLTPKADLALQMRWMTEWRNQTWHGHPPPPDPTFNEGHIMAVPFKIERFK